VYVVVARKLHTQQQRHRLAQNQIILISVAGSIHDMKVLVLILSFICASSYSCLDENGLPTDMWVVLVNSEAPNYYYYNFSEPAAKFAASPFNVFQTKDGAIMQTTNQLYSFEDGADVGLGMWNDEAPNGYDASDTYAHSKGFIMTDLNQGFLVAHSKPQWPDARNSTNNSPAPFPDDQYAQSLVCMTISAATANKIAAGLQINRPYIYSSYISPSVAEALPTLNAWLTKQTVSTVNATQDFYTVGGKKITQFAKSKVWGRDLYDDFVSPFYGTALDVETWIDGSGGRMSTMCANSTDVVQFDIFEVNKVEMSDGTTWLNTQDHSKWCFSVNSSEDISCIGDINRMCSQEGRGGGAYCLVDDGLHTAFSTVVASVESCFQENPCTGSSACYWCSLTQKSRYYIN
jgi:deoxyribonuclease-2